MLKPQLSESRNLLSLDGLWDFAVDFCDASFQEKWWGSRLADPLQVAVPASYNDLFTDVKIREHVGWVWYQRTVTIPQNWKGELIYIRVDSATHEGVVYVNDTEVARHVGGYMPFEADITEHALAGSTIRVSIGVNNVLSNITIPPGELKVQEDGRKVQIYQHDFYNYAGLARSVWIYTKPKSHVDDLTVVTTTSGTTGNIEYTAVVSSGDVKVNVLDRDGLVVGSASGASGSIQIENAKLWNPGAAYLYTLEVLTISASATDVYRLKVGIRTVEVKGNQFLINGKPFYFTGFGMHEDHVVKGKGHDNSFMVNDFELLKWIGANSFRTSHYPYAEEVLDYADEQGIVVIDETAAVGLNLALMGGVFGGEAKPTYSPDTCNDQTQAALLQALRELIARDKNHPSVVMWSITNEADSVPQESYDFFAPAFALTHELDSTRPNTYINVMFAPVDKCKIASLADVICLNRYWGWYVDHYDLESAEKHFDAELTAWEKEYQVPIVITEYGADTYAGAHSIHGLPWSEEYQIEYIAMNHRVFDRHPSVVGEQIWNFADFQTKPGIFRVLGNKKGVFTRDRQPKSVAHSVRQRWTSLNNSKPSK
jgi:beta-glucuronidase